MATAQIYTKDQVDEKDILYNVTYTLGVEHFDDYSGATSSICATFQLCMKKRDYESLQPDSWTDRGSFLNSMKQYMSSYDNIYYYGPYIEDILDNYEGDCAFIPCSGSFATGGISGSSASSWNLYPLLGIIFYDQDEVRFIYLNKNGRFSHIECSGQDLSDSYCFVSYRQTV